MATIEKRVRNGRVTYRARYRDPAGGQRSKVFARKADAQRFLNETETAKARAPGPTLRWDGRCSGTGWRSGGRPRRTCVPRPGPGRAAASTHGPAELRRCAAGRDQSAGRAGLGGVAERPGPGPSHGQKAYQLLGKVMGAAVDAGMLAQSPCRRVPLPKAEREEMRF
jgi:hypothetical protein